MSIKLARSMAAAGLILAGMISVVTEAAAQGKPPARPNIVLIVLDDTGFADLGSFGGEIATPNLDQIAAQGTRFTNFHVASACNPTRAMLYTGVDSHLAGVGNLDDIQTPEQAARYPLYIPDDVVSVGTLLKDAGYRTLFSGKWHLGKTPDRTPISQGFDKAFTLADTGADNWTGTRYAPLNEEAHWYDDTKPFAPIPDDFYSSRYIVDRMLGYLDAGKDDQRPFFAVVALLATHYPHQAPKDYIDKYAGRYDIGWDRLRADRYQRQVEMGLMPAGLTLKQFPGLPPWDSLSAEERRDYAKKMAVYAGMLDAADAQIGRLRDYLRQRDQLDNTLFVVLSDNGADSVELPKIFWFWFPFHYSTATEKLGEKGTYSSYGPGWAQASNTPGYGYKGTAAEGGVRTPMILSWPGAVKAGATAASFAHVKDIFPTLLEAAGVDRPGGEYKGRKVRQADGRSLMPYLRGETPDVHPPDEAVGFEMAGGFALYRDGYKLVKDLPPTGDRQWQLFDIRSDPAESRDLSAAMPERKTQMIADVTGYIAGNNVVVLPDSYDPLEQLSRNKAPLLLRELWPFGAGALAVVGLFLWGVWRIGRRLFGR